MLCFLRKLTVAAIALVVFSYVALGNDVRRPISQSDLTRLHQLGIPAEIIEGRIRKNGITFEPDSLTLDTLRREGVEERVLKVLTASQPVSTAAIVPVEYQDVLSLLELGVAEDAILIQLANSPTTFVLDATQREQLIDAGASRRLLDALEGDRETTPDYEITDFALILDCSGSMQEPTSDGVSKMEAARSVLHRLVQELPAGLRLTVVAYGGDRANACESVEVLRPLEKFTESSRPQLQRVISALSPGGQTPIAAALMAAGDELRRTGGHCGIALVSDGKETCGGDPAAETRRLAEELNLSFGLHVIGFGVEGAESEALRELATVGGGQYHQASDAAALATALAELGDDLQRAFLPEQRATRGLRFSGAEEGGLFFHDAPLVPAGEYTGQLHMTEARYFRIPLNKGQQLRAVGLFQKGPFQAYNGHTDQAFTITLYDDAFNVIAREENVVTGFSTTPTTLRAVHAPDQDTTVYIAVAASQCFQGDGIPGEVYQGPAQPSQFKLRLKVDDDEVPVVTSAAPVDFVQLEGGAAFASAARLEEVPVEGVGTGGDIKFNEAQFYQVEVEKGQQVVVSLAVAKPLYEVVNAFHGDASRATYRVTLYDDDQVNVGESEIVIPGIPADAATTTVTWDVELSGAMWISVSADNSGNKIAGEADEVLPARYAVQVVAQ